MELPSSPQAREKIVRRVARDGFTTCLLGEKTRGYGTIPIIFNWASRCAHLGQLYDNTIRCYTMLRYDSFCHMRAFFSSCAPMPLRILVSLSTIVGYYTILKIIYLKILYNTIIDLIRQILTFFPAARRCPYASPSACRRRCRRTRLTYTRRVKVKGRRSVAEDKCNIVDGSRRIIVYSLKGV